MAKSTADQGGASPPTGRGWAARLLPALIILIALVSVFATGLHKHLTLDALQENREALIAYVAANRILALAAFMAAYAAATAVSLPGASIFSIAGGFLFGLWLGTAAVVVSATFGAVAIYAAARTAFGDVLRGKLGKLSAGMEKGLREDELSYLFILRLVPLFPFWAVNIAAGLFDVRLRNFLIATFIGIIPGSFVYVSIGNGIGAAFDAGEEVSLSGVLTNPAFVIPVAGLLVLALIPIAYKRLRRAKGGAS